MASIFKPGDILEEEFILKAFIGQGAQAEIWEARYVNYEARGALAIKIHYALWEDRDDHKFVENERRLIQEQNLLGSIRSRFIVVPLKRLGQPFETEGRLYKIAGLVMDLASEGSLQQFLTSDHFSRYGPIDKLELLKQLIDGLHDIQKHRIIHTDIKPANILVTWEPSGYTCRYADFGYAYELGQPQSYGGTRGYMAPELENKTHPSSFESDMYSLAVVFYEALTGIHPANSLGSGPPLNQVLGGHLPTDEYFNVSDLESAYSRTFTRLIEQMGSRDPDSRSTVADVQEGLTQVIAALRLESFQHSAEIVPELAGRYRWASGLHAAFGEKEHLAFLTVDHPDLSASSIAKALEIVKIYGFAIFRVLGAHDYLVRVWCNDADRSRLERALSSYQARPGSQSRLRMFAPQYRWPQPPPRRGGRGQLEKQSEVLDFLESLTDATAGPRNVNFARSAGLIAGIAKRVREAEPAPETRRTSSGRDGQTRKRPIKHNIRAICYVKASKEISPDLTNIIAEKVYQQVQPLEGVTELEVLASPGGQGVPSEFVLVMELAQLHDYRRVLGLVGQYVGSLSELPVAEYRSNFEMDPVPEFEAYDGQLLYQLQRRRQRNRRFD